MVTVIVPNYNHRLYIKQRIDSILNQTYRNFELIILDDYSTDNSREIIDLYKNNSHVSHIVYNSFNSGSPFFQWEKGIELAKYNYIWIAESDDYIEKVFLEEVINRFNTDESIGIVYCDSNIVDNKNITYNFYKKFRNSTFKTNRWDNDFVTDGKDEIEKYLLFECTINNTSAMVFKKNLVQQSIFKDLKKFKYSGDWYFFLCIAYTCKVCYISKAHNYFRIGQNNFKEGVRTYLNYFKERSLVRYLAIINFQYQKETLKKVINSLGTELRHQIFELIKGKIKFRNLYYVCRELYTTQKYLFVKQLTHLY